MKPIHRHRHCRCRPSIALIVILLVIHGCASAPTIVGHWKAVEGNAGVNFTADGVFHAVDNEGMPVSGTYRLKGSDGIQFEIRHGAEEIETIDARVIRVAGRLTLAFPGENAVETYERIP